MQFYLTIKGLFSLPLRQAMGMAQSLLKLAGLDWRVPDFSTVGRRQKHLAVTVEAHATTTGLHLLLASSGIKMLGDGEWKTENVPPTTVVNCARSILASMRPHGKFWRSR